MSAAVDAFWADLKQRGVIHGSDVDTEDIGASLFVALAIERREVIAEAADMCAHDGYDCNCYDSVLRLPGGDRYEERPLPFGLSRSPDPATHGETIRVQLPEHYR